jgi:hypothetical protein
VDQGSCLVNVEALSVVKRARDLCLLFANQRCCMGAVDESTSIKGHKSAQSQVFVVEKLAPLLRFRYIMSGLVAPQSPLDLYPQFEFLGHKLLGYSSYWAFRARYAVINKMQAGGQDH